MKSKVLVGSSLAIGAALLGAAAVIAPRWLEPAPAIELRADAHCDLHQGSCAVAIPGGGTMTLALTPRPIEPMKPMQMEVTFSGIEARDVIVDFKGADMNMGVNRFPLREMDGGKFAGQGVIPVCVRKRMVWDAWVLASTDSGRYAAPFRFATSRP